MDYENPPILIMGRLITLELVIKSSVIQIIIHYTPIVYDIISMVRPPNKSSTNQTWSFPNILASITWTAPLTCPIATGGRWRLVFHRLQWHRCRWSRSAPVFECWIWPSKNKWWNIWELNKLNHGNMVTMDIFHHDLIYQVYHQEMIKPWLNHEFTRNFTMETKALLFVDHFMGHWRTLATVKVVNPFQHGLNMDLIWFNLDLIWFNVVKPSQK